MHTSSTTETNALDEWFEEVADQATTLRSSTTDDRHLDLLDLVNESARTGQRLIEEPGDKLYVRFRVGQLKRLVAHLEHRYDL